MTSLYRAVLAERFDLLPAAVRELHNHESSVTYRGRGSVERGSGWLSRLVGAMMRFPPAADDVAVSVQFDIRDGIETWTRDFTGHRFSSRLSKQGDHLAESFGPMQIRFRLDADAAGINMVPLRWALLGAPLPTWVWPKIVARESQEDGRFCFFVEAVMPGAGLVVRYRGWLGQNGMTLMSENIEGRLDIGQRPETQHPQALSKHIPQTLELARLPKAYAPQAAPVLGFRPMLR